MKTTKCYLAVATLVVFCMTSCNQEDSLVSTDLTKSEILLSSAIVQIPSIDQSPQNTQFAAGSKIGLFVTDNTATPAELYTNKELNADGSGLLAVKPNENMYYASNDLVNLYAYYPFNAAATLSMVLPFNVKADQNSVLDYRASDLMWGVPVSNPVKRTTDVVKIGFVHKLAKVTVNLISGAGSPDLKGATVTILNVLPSTTLNVKTGEITAASGTEAPIKMATFARDATTFDCSAVVVPQTVVATNQFIEVLLANGAKLYYKVPVGGITFTSGKSYIYHVTVNFTELTVSSQITDWTEGNGTGDNGNATMTDLL